MEYGILPPRDDGGERHSTGPRSGHPLYAICYPLRGTVLRGTDTRSNACNGARSVVRATYVLNREKAFVDAAVP